MFWVMWAIVSLVVWGITNLWMTGQVTGRNWWASLIAALVGGWLGDWLLGDWLWVVAGFNVIAGVIGSGVFNWLWSLVSKQKG
ncbi:hypothetical protein ACQCN2_13395 [Brevibacillus ginsengisoli]|uniref:hypothetical protein n=1 Tax=Brevibacillus ginsengisoli TaxID=363854 RepID=UPI003CE88C19